MWKLFQSTITLEHFFYDTDVVTPLPNHVEVSDSTIPDARISIRAKLAAMGLTPEEVTALLGPTHIYTQPDI